MNYQLMDAVVRLRAAACQASTGPWRASSSCAVAAPEHKTAMDSKDAEYYGGHLVAESMSPRDVLYLTVASPNVVIAICDAVIKMLKEEQRREHYRALNDEARNDATAACETALRAIKSMGGHNG